MTEREIELTDVALRERAMSTASHWFQCWPGVTGVYGGPAIKESLAQALVHFTEMVLADRRGRACATGGRPMTEREIAEVLRAVPCYVCKDRHYPLTDHGHALSPDIPAMARAVAEQVVGPLQELAEVGTAFIQQAIGELSPASGIPWRETLKRLTDEARPLAIVCQRHGCMWEAHEHCESTLADRDARLARLEEALTFEALREANVRRCEEVFHPLVAWSLTDWATAAAGEFGEACNVIKKMRRHEGSHNDPTRNIDPATDEGRRALAHEIADAVMYLDLLAARAGISLGTAVREKFNLVSRRYNSAVVLADAGAGKERGDG